MPAAWIEPRRNKTGLQYRVRFRQAGHSSPRLYGGSFRLRRHAEIRRDFILGEMAAGRVPNLRLVAPERSPTVLDACDRWRATRVDVTPATQVLHRVALARVTK